MTITEAQEKPKYTVPSKEDLERSRKKLMPLIDEMIKEGKIH